MGSFGRLSGRSILVVEDEPLIAIGLKVLLEDEGADVEIASNPGDALRLADETSLFGGHSRFRLGGQRNAPLCRVLRAYAIPFMFYTGYHDVHESLSGPPIVTKPGSSEKLIATIAGLLDSPLHAGIGQHSDRSGLARPLRRADPVLLARGRSPTRHVTGCKPTSDHELSRVCRLRIVRALARKHTGLEP